MGFSIVTIWAEPMCVIGNRACVPAFFLYIFQNRFLQKYIFGFTIYRFIPLLPGRGYVIKISVLSNGGPYRLAGGRQAPPNIKAEVPPIFAANNIHRGKRRDVG